MIEQEITLLTNGRISFQKCGNGLQFGYSKNRGVYSIRVKTSGEWNGLTIRAFWHIPDIKEPITSLLVDNVIKVPALVTSYKGEGRIVFEGSDGTKTVTSADVRYYVNKNSGTCDGTIPEPGTPAWQQLVEAVHADATAAEQAKTDARKSADEAKQALEDTKNVKDQAIENIGIAKDSAIEGIEDKKSTSIEEINKVKESAKKELEDVCNITEDFANQAKESADKAKVSELAAKESETKSKISETNSKASENLAEQYKDSASTSADSALESKESASQSEVNAIDAANRAAISEANAKLSETASDNSSKKAFDSETKAKVSETNSANSATNAEHSATNATASADAAKSSADKAKTSETVSTANTAEVAKNLEAVRDIKAKIDILDANVSANAASSDENANKAKISADEAKQSETNAASSEASALESKNVSAENAAKSQNNASNAKNSADSAKESEIKAQEYSNLSQSNANASSESASNAKASEDASKKNADDSAATLQELKDGIASGNFKGDKGDPGPTGADGKDAPQIDDATVTDSAPWSSKHIVDILCPPLDETGNPVQCYPVAGYSLDVKVSWEPTQEGSGDTSPDNVRPIKGRDSVKVERCGENLCNVNHFVGSYWVDDNYHKSNDFVNIHSSFWASYKMPCNVGDTINASGFPELDGISCVWTSDVSGEKYFKEAGSSQMVNTSYAVPSGARCLVLGVAGKLSVPDANYDNAMISIGTSPTTYTPYTGQTSTLTLPRTIYGGTVDAVTGEGNENAKIITLDGNELKFTKVNTYINLPVHSAPGILKGGIICCSHFNRRLFAVNTTYEFCFLLESDMTSLFASVDDLNAYLAAQYAAGTPVQIAYKLAEPVPFTATGAQPIPALSGVNTVLTDADNATVTGRADPIKRITDLEDAVASMTTT